MGLDMNERRERIVLLTNAEGSVTFAQIKHELPDVSEMTLRTDLKALDDERRLIRVHGGARSVGYAVGTDDLLAARQTRNVAAKITIAEKAASLVRSDTTIFLDSGSTTTALAGALSDERIIIFTTGISCLSELARLEKPSVIVPGGHLNRYSMSLSGSRAIRSINSLVFDQAFIGVTSVSESGTFYCGSDEECELKQACIHQAEQVIMLMDTSKLGRRSTFTICDLEDVDVIVSDGQLPADLIQRCQATETEVI